MPVKRQVQQLLDLPGKLTDAFSPGHASGALDRMERAANVGQQCLIAELVAPSREPFTQRCQFLVELFEEDRHQVEIIGVERGFAGRAGFRLTVRKVRANRLGHRILSFAGFLPGARANGFECLVRFEFRIFYRRCLFGRFGCGSVAGINGVFRPGARFELDR